MTQQPKNAPLITPGKPVDLHAEMEKQRVVGILWGIEDVQHVRPDLSDEQSWEVLQRCKKHHDCESGWNWDYIDTVAEMMFPEFVAIADD